MENAIIITPKDDVVTVTQTIHPGDTVVYSINGQEHSVVARQEIPVYHTIAVHAVKKDSSVIKYGEHIGYATADIAVGDHVHTQNLGSEKKED